MLQAVQPLVRLSRRDVTIVTELMVTELLVLSDCKREVEALVASLYKGSPTPSFFPTIRTFPLSIPVPINMTILPIGGERYILHRVSFDTPPSNLARVTGRRCSRPSDLFLLVDFVSSIRYFAPFCPPHHHCCRSIKQKPSRICQKKKEVTKARTNKEAKRMPHKKSWVRALFRLLFPALLNSEMVYDSLW